MSISTTQRAFAPRPQKVLIHVHNLELGGSQINAVDLAAGVREFGYDAVVVGPADSRPVGPSLYDVAADRKVTLESFVRPRTTAQGARDLSSIAARHSIDLVHVYGTWSVRPAYWGPCLFARRPLLMTVYEMSVDPVVYHAPALVVGTGYLVDDLRTRRGSVHLISPPVDLARDCAGSVSTAKFIAQHRLDNDRVRLVIVSRLDGKQLRPIKSTGIELAMRAIARCPELNLELVIVGTGNEEERLRQIGDEVNAELARRACVFTGPMADPRPAYASADVVLGMGGSAARGLAFGKPLVVLGEYGWCSTFTQHTSAALFRNSFWSEEPIVDPIDRLVCELRPLLDSPDERRRLGALGRAFAESSFGLRSMSERLAQIYSQAIQGYGPGDWLYDQRLEGRWALGWLARRVLPAGAVQRRVTAWSDRARDRSQPGALELGGSGIATVAKGDSGVSEKVSL